MSLKDLGPWLLSKPGFVAQLDRVVADAVSGEFGNNFTGPRELWDEVPHDWRYLLLAASVLAASEEGVCQSAALRIAQTCLTNGDTSLARRDAAAVILDTLSNHPAIALAVRRQLLRPHFESRLPAPARIEWTRRLLESSVVLSNNEVLRLNRFQRRFWDDVDVNDWISASAPTSAGKSFVVTRWIGELLHRNPTASVVYIVPTRALINQVEHDLKLFFQAENLHGISVTSLPVARALNADGGNVLVFTQERLQILSTAVPDLAVDVLIVDEAHKVGDRQRGVLLQFMIESITARHGAKVIFASPMTSNPEILLTEAGAETRTAAFASEDVTVSQNLIWISQASGKPKFWDVLLCLPHRQLPLGTLALSAVPGSESKRLSYVAYAMGQDRPGNIVYVNGAADAEKIASQLYDLGGDKADIKDSRIDDLIDLARRIVHRDFRLATVLRRGIAFHYGNLPLLIRAEVERLFSEGVIKYLVCTSTLVEGVNMSCRSIYLRGPQKGKGKPMSAEDFWNLAGRAGRWGKEFQGNVVCVDATRKGVWGEDGPPRTRAKYEIRRTSDTVLGNPAALVDYIRAENPRDFLRRMPELEAVFSYLVTMHFRYGSVFGSPWATRYKAGDLAAVAEVIAETADKLLTPAWVVERNPGISPLSMDSLLAYFRRRTKPVEELLPTDPADENALAVYTAIFVRVSRHITPRLGPTPGRSAMLALTVIRWMRGFPLARLITDRIDYHNRTGRPESTATVIRGVMEEVEQIARFEAPRSLACYRDVLEVHLTEIGRPDLIEHLPDLGVLLELGVSQQTQVSLIGLGLTRTAAVMLADLIAADDLTERGALDWITANRALWFESDLPALVRREIEAVVPQPLPKAG